MIPQAYTSRDMSEAYKWLQTLPESARGEFKTAEDLVLNYLKAKRMGALSNFQPEGAKKSQEFQQTLQNLKTEMDQFNFEPAAAPTATAASPSVVLDSKSRQTINSIREGLNLSTDQEVIRMALALAQKSLKNLLE